MSRPRRLARLLAGAVLALGGCPKPVLEPPPALVPPPPVPETPPAGHVTDGAYVDASYPLTVVIPPGWHATVGDRAAPVRLTLDAPDDFVRVEIAAVPGDTLAPRPRDGCAWSFTDEARYRALKVQGNVLVATCTPADPGGQRVLAYVFAHDGVTWHLEGSITPGHLPAGKVELDQIVGAVRFR